jgi:hypothetical protein
VATKTDLSHSRDEGFWDELRGNPSFAVLTARRLP